MRVTCCHECWKRRCAVLNDPEVEMNVFQVEGLSIKEEYSEGQVEGLRRCATLRSINVNEVSVEEMQSWERNIRAFKKKDTNNKNLDIRVC